jgi:general secretion pathway protein D
MMQIHAMTRMFQPMTARTLTISLLAGALAACASVPQPQVHRTQRSADAEDAKAGSGDIRKEILQELGSDGPQPVIRRGNGGVINQKVASAPPPSLASSGQASFNFEGESLQAVVKAILGDMLGQSYSIAPGVQGTVTVATQKPVGAAGALSLLDQVLAQNNARMVYSDGRYNIVTADQALQNGAALRTGSPATARGFESRVVPLHFVSATEMEKILKPYARQGSIVTVDGARNLITIAGTRAELENYLRTIQVFDVDWMSSMSVGVFPLQSGKATDVVQDLERVFGEQGKTPVAGMFRFMPLEATNSVMVITAQPSYLDEIHQWIDRIEGGSGDGRLFSYELKYIKARDLADRLSEVFGGKGGSQNEDANASLMPGVQGSELRDGSSDDRSGLSSTGAGGTGLGQGGSLPQSRGGNGRVTLKVGGAEVGVSAVEDTNSLLVRASAAQWKSIREVIDRLDVMPMQVQIEAQVISVALKGDLQYGVSWFFDHAVNSNAAGNLPYPTGRNSWGSYSGGVNPMSNGGGNLLSWTFLGKNAAAIVSALDSVTDVRTLSSPSVLAQNNREATLNVGQRIPIASVSFNPNGGSTNGTYSQVQYLDTGIILKVRPRITRDGMVFLDIVQEVSKPAGVADIQGNVRIDTSKVTTSAVAPSGDTIMLAGLITDGSQKGSTGVPGLSRIPIIGGLFGQQSNGKSRDELVVLITPTVVRNPLEARSLTDEYGRRFRALDPIYNPKKK